MTTLTKSDLKLIGLTAADICGCLWHDTIGATVEDRLAAVLATRNLGGDADLTDNDRRKLEALLAAVQEETYDLCAENNDTIREATVAELCESMQAGPEGWIDVDGVRAYVQF